MLRRVPETPPKESNKTQNSTFYHPHPQDFTSHPAQPFSSHSRGKTSKSRADKRTKDARQKPQHSKIEGKVDTMPRTFYSRAPEICKGKTKNDTHNLKRREQRG
jgi:hypothetical protein